MCRVQKESGEDIEASSLWMPLVIFDLVTFLEALHSPFYHSWSLEIILDQFTYLQKYSIKKILLSNLIGRLPVVVFSWIEHNNRIFHNMDKSYLHIFGHIYSIHGVASWGCQNHRSFVITVHQIHCCFLHHFNLSWKTFL